MEGPQPVLRRSTKLAHYDLLECLDRSLTRGNPVCHCVTASNRLLCGLSRIGGFRSQEMATRYPGSIGSLVRRASGYGASLRLATGGRSAASP